MTDSTSLAAALADRYRLERELGAGGMATVYLAEDLKHDRKVALKVLRPELAAVLGADRFVQEIKTTAALQHPHILPLFDSGEAGGFLFYVMPYVEGETLRDKLNRETQLSIDEAVRITTDVADALDYAHRHGVVHRDIKPENILLHDGRPMVADFGIALALSAAAGGRMTETGMSLGTPHYMSPEQATADKDITGRSDIYSLASVLYEMLAGEPPHLGGSAQQVIMKIVTDQARPVTELRKSVPANVAAALAKALEKVPADRFDSAKAFADALADPHFTLGPGAIAAVASARGERRFVWPVAAALLGAVALWGWLRPGPVALPSRQRVVLWRASFADFLSSSALSVASRVAISPDGEYIAFTDSAGGDTQLFLKARNDTRARPIAGTEGAVSALFSPDGQWIGYFTHGGIVKKVRVSGGGSIQLATAGSTTYQAGAWLDDGTVVFADNSSGMSRVSGEGGPVTPLRAPRSDHLDDPSAISPLPGSHAVLFTGCPGNCASASAVYAYDIRRDTTLLLIANAAGGWYSPTGHLLYVGRTGGLFAVGFDPKQLKITSGAVSIADSVAPNGLALSASGTALLLLGTEDFSNSYLVWVSRDGSEERIEKDWTGNFEYPAIAPDGKTIAVSVRNAVTELWVRHADGSRIRITHGDLGSWRPSFTPDGASFSFITASGASSDSGASDAYLSPTDGSTPPRLLLHIQPKIWEAEFSRDGAWEVFRTDDPASYGVFWARRLRGDTTLSMIYNDSSFNTQLALSPDSKWLAFTSDHSGKSEVYVASFPDMQIKYPVSQGGGTEPRWAHSGRELFFRSHGQLMSLPVTPGAGFAPGKARPLFSVAPYADAINRQEYDVSPDDRRFLLIRRPQKQAHEEVVLVEHFFEDLEAKVKP
jgi:Tol biopolymer transport system component